MLMKYAYITAATAALALMLVEGPRGGVLTSSPERAKVQRQAGAGAGGGATVRRPFIFIGGISRGK